MPRAILHLPSYRGPREHDVGFLISEARAAGMFVRKLAEQRVELVATKSQDILFSGDIPQAVAFLQRPACER